MSSAAAPPRRRAAGPFHPSVIAVHACDLSLRCCCCCCCYAERGAAAAAAAALGYRKSAVKTLKKISPFFAAPCASVLRSPRGMDAYAGMGILD